MCSSTVRGTSVAAASHEEIPSPLYLPDVTPTSMSAAATRTKRVVFTQATAQPARARLADVQDVSPVDPFSAQHLDGHRWIAPPGPAWVGRKKPRSRVDVAVHEIHAASLARNRAQVRTKVAKPVPPDETQSRKR